jgi:hypothetical protein
MPLQIKQVLLQPHQIHVAGISLAGSAFAYNSCENAGYASISEHAARNKYFMNNDVNVYMATW